MLIDGCLVQQHYKPKYHHQSRHSVVASHKCISPALTSCKTNESISAILTIMLQAAGHLFEVSLQMQRSFRHPFRFIYIKTAITCIMRFEYLSGILNQVAQRSLVSQFFMSTSMSIWMVTAAFAIRFQFFCHGRTRRGLRCNNRHC